MCTYPRNEPSAYQHTETCTTSSNTAPTPQGKCVENKFSQNFNCKSAQHVQQTGDKKWCECQVPYVVIFITTPSNKQQQFLEQITYSNTSTQNLSDHSL